MTLPQLLRDRAARHPERIVYRFLERGTETGTLTFGQLDQRVRDISAMLTARNLVGERVGLVFAPGLDFMAAFWGCLCAGAIAVPVFPPRDRPTGARMASILKDAGATTVLTTKEVLSRTRLLRWTDSNLRKFAWLSVDKLPASTPTELPQRAADPNAVAFLQYTSGSTSDPKGVMVTHRNLHNNARVIEEAAQLSEASVIVGWIPLYHDMGLIGNVLQAVYSGAPYVGMSPVDFLLRPFDFLKAISTYRGTASAMPNFGFELAMRKVTAAQRATLDLSSWTTCLNGAEQVRLDTLIRFANQFADSGLSPFALRPTYGLAESTLIVSLGEFASPIQVLYADAEELERHRVCCVDASHPQARALVGCGRPRPGQTVAIVDPETLIPCGPEEVGEIWLAGDSIAAGYWGREELTRQVFGARPLGTAKTYLRTGDLGFLHEGELFMTGRLKDVIILRGRNVYPQDIELSVERADESLRRGCCAAVAVELDGEERLVVVAEVRREFDPKRVVEVIDAVRRCVQEDNEVGPFAVQLLAAGTIPKTSSGKLRRRAIGTAYKAGSLTALKRGSWSSSGTAEPVQQRSSVLTAEVAPNLAWVEVRKPRALVRV
jgi:acyl-CoA synthetase (AMP-forming)/AMP-acid ligase II